MDVRAYPTYIPIIVYVETLLWYKRMGLTKQTLDVELTKIRSSVKQITEEIADRTTFLAIKHGHKFHFRYHARDYIIGSTALDESATLITYNIDDFEWLHEEGCIVLTPEQLIAENLRK